MPVSTWKVFRSSGGGGAFSSWTRVLCMCMYLCVIPCMAVMSSAPWIQKPYLISPGNAVSITADIWWSNHKINNYFKCNCRRYRAETFRWHFHSVAAGFGPFKQNKSLKDQKKTWNCWLKKNTASCHHAVRCINNIMTGIPLYLLSAMLSNSSDEELCAHCSTEVLWICLRTHLDQAGNTRKADCSAQGSLMCFVWMRWKRCVCVSWLQPSQQC